MPLFELLSYSFMRNAFAAGIAVACIAPLLGVFLTVRRQSLIADTLSHASLAGVAVGVLFGIAPIWGAALAAIFAALLIEQLRSAGKLPGESTLALVLSGSLALAVVVMSASQRFNAGLLSYLFGSITTVTEAEAFGIVAVASIFSVIVIFLFSRLMLVAFDEEVAIAQGVPVYRYNILLAIMTAVTVAVGMRVVGVLLMSALLVIPALTAMRISHGFRLTAVIAVIIGIFSVISGLTISYYIDLAAGGTMVLVMIACFILASLMPRYKI